MSRGPKPIPPVERILPRLIVVQSGCWLWPGATNGGNPKYGIIGVPREGDGRTATGYVHRITYEYFIGPIPSDYELDHFRCNTSLCANPTHTEPVTPEEHKRRERERYLAIGKCRMGHVLAKVGIYVWGGVDHCMECRRINARRLRARVKQSV
jgi:HNH endonuclease